MRTQGDFNKIYTAAREYLYESADDCPMNPVIRLEGDIWMLESELEPANDNCVFETTLDAFQNWWYEGMKDTQYIPSEIDIADFLAAHSE